MKKPEWFDLANYSFLYDLHPIQQLFLFQKKANLIEDLRNYDFSLKCIGYLNAVWEWKNYQSLFHQGKTFHDSDIEESEHFLENYLDLFEDDANIQMFSIDSNDEISRLKAHLDILGECNMAKNNEVLFLQLDLTRPASLIKKDLADIVDYLYKDEKLIPFSQNPLKISPDGTNERAKSISHNQLFPYMDLLLDSPEYISNPKKITPSAIGKILHSSTKSTNADLSKAGDETRQRLEKYMMEIWF